MKVGVRGRSGIANIYCFGFVIVTVFTIVAAVILAVVARLILATADICVPR